MKFTILPKLCNECGTLPLWNGKPLNLQLDHKDGDPTNNLLENLRLLCPNCHSQTSNFSGKNMKKKTKIPMICSTCGINSVSNLKKSCTTCRGLKNEKISWPNNEELKNLVWSVNMTELGHQLGISANAIKKRCTKRGIPIPRYGRKNGELIEDRTQLDRFTSDDITKML